ncbi:MAG TPA: primosomal protein N', partial [Candidatus Cloacimonadota bacterium]|nr:primosomal protein N' [Candidatus Cloacimonadota bacterium]
MKMHYYQVFLNIDVDKPYTYSSITELLPGIRVIVQFGHSFKTGIVGEEIPSSQLDSKIKYREIHDIVDISPIVLPELLKTASWISRYYQCAPGKAVFALIPAALHLEIMTQLRKSDKPNSDVKFDALIESFADDEWYKVTEIQSRFSASGFFKLVEEAESEGLIQVKRNYDERVKPKKANFIFVDQVREMPALTPKQEEAYQFFSALGDSFPMAQVADAYTYQMIHALEKKGLLHIEQREVETKNDILPKNQAPRQIFELTEEQSIAINAIRNSLGKNDVFLLFGITGSGKTEIYIQCIEKCLTLGQNVLMLIPEISLTPQMVDRFYRVFGAQIAILHSQLSERERFQQWKDIHSGKCRIVIGARSAVFAPLSDVGMIIVDEEHENSYKQDNIPRYNARDVAILRAKFNNAVVVLGSATPSLESWHNAQNGKYKVITLKQRPITAILPKVEIVDMRETESESLFSDILIQKIQERLDRKEQVILLQNRRGYASFVQCQKCGELLECPDCDISLFYHRHNENLLCHYCGYTAPLPRKCPKCGNHTFNFGIAGTQKVEQQLRTFFPTARILRMDSDTTTKKDSYHYMFNAMRLNEVDILFGTQMISKGLDFPNVTLVGVILADLSLSVPDFRAGEKTFQILTQVAGRSGRGDKL